MLFWFSSFAFFTCLFLWLMVMLNRNTWKMHERISPYVKGREVGSTGTIVLETEEQSFKERFLKYIVNPIRQFALLKMSKEHKGALEKKLQEAGNPFKWTPVDFRIIQLGSAAGLFCLSLFMILSGTNELGKSILMSSIFAVYGYFSLNFYLNAMKKKRIKDIEKSMSDFFDLVTVSIEAGLGLDGALKKVCKQMKSPLADEFLYTLEDMKLGKSRRLAFIALRDRVPSEFFQSVMNSLIQADQMGIGLTKVLRAQTGRIREMRRQKVKEQAMKAPVKMLIPMVIFIFPTLFIVLLGPVLIEVVTKWL